MEVVQSKGDVKAQQQFLGDMLYQQIGKISPENAARVTGMMLGLGLEKCINDLKNPTDLQKTVSEALNMLKQQQQGPQ
jgi:hypothetical protein